MPLTENQRAILEWWIAKGAAANMPLAKHTPDARMKEVLEEYFQIHRDVMLDIAAEPVSVDDLEDLRAAGFRVNRISSAGTAS
jgi:phosphoglycolate phosphatase-like HAD superfamily hydrolase